MRIHSRSALPLFSFLLLLSSALLQVHAAEPVLPRIDVYGDSTVAGWTGSAMAAPAAPAVMAGLLPGFAVRNLGTSGSTLDDALPGWAGRMQAAPARLVIVNWGLNDAIRCDARSFEANLRQLVAMTPYPLALETPNTVRQSALVSAERQRCVTRLAAITRALAAELKLPLIDVYQFTDALVSEEPSLLPDGMHPSAKLYALIGAYMARIVQPLIKQERRQP